MDRKKGTFERHLYDSAHPEKRSRPLLKKTITFADDHITFITEDATRTIWIGKCSRNRSDIKNTGNSIDRNK